MSLAGNPIEVGTDVSIEQLTAGALIYTPALNDNGPAHATFSFQVRDDGGLDNGGVDLDAIPNTLTFDVAPVSDAPFGTDMRLSQLEDSTSVLSVSDFGFQDLADNDAFISVIIDQLPAAGSLTLNGLPVIPGQVIVATDIDSGLLSFTPDPNEHGVGYGEINFRVQDSGTDGGSATAALHNVLSIDVIPVNDAPSGQNATIQTFEDTPYTFRQADFGFSDNEGFEFDTLSSVIIVSLPDSGKLSIDGTEATVGQEVPVSLIDAGLLVYTPPLNETGTGYNGLGFKVRDSGGTDNGGIDTDPTERFISFDVPGVNDPPRLISEGGTVDEGAELTLTSAMLFGADADDPEPQELTITITSLPDHGALRLAGDVLSVGDQFTLAEIESLALSYLHDESETSQDSFGVSLADGGEDGAQPVNGIFELLLSLIHI